MGRVDDGDATMNVYPEYTFTDLESGRGNFSGAVDPVSLTAGTASAERAALSADEIGDRIPGSDTKSAEGAFSGQYF